MTFKTAYKIEALIFKKIENLKIIFMLVILIFLNI